MAYEPKKGSHQRLNGNAPFKGHLGHLRKELVRRRVSSLRWTRQPWKSPCAKWQAVRRLIRSQTDRAAALSARQQDSRMLNSSVANEKTAKLQTQYNNDRTMLADQALAESNNARKSVENT